MKASQRFFLKTSGIFALVMVGVQLIMSFWLGEKSWDWIDHLIFPLVWGAMMGGLSTFSQRKILTRKGLDPEKVSDWSPHQAEEFLVKCEREEVWATLLAELPARKRWRLKERIPAQGKLIFRRGMNLWSYGEEVTIRLRDMNEGYTLVQTESRPIVSFTLVDYGIGKGNIHTVRKLLASLDLRGAEPALDQEPDPELDW